MVWYNNIITRLNPAQPLINEQIEPSTSEVGSFTNAYEKLELVNRGINMLVDDVAEIPTKVGDQTKGIRVVKGIKKAKVDLLLNHEPNLFQDINTFRRNLIIDYLLDGNIFIYFDGRHLYHLPAPRVTIHGSEKNYIEKFTFESIKYNPDEIIHVKENSFNSITRGTSRLKPALRTMKLMASMRNFQDKFFVNGAVPGLIISTPNTLSQKIKTKLISSWMSIYRPNAGGRRPMILDGGMTVDPLTKVNFKDLDFENSIERNEKVILKGIGIPPVLLDSGNNSNLRPNMRLYYLETVLPIVRKLNFALERYFGYLLTEDAVNIQALQPELRDQALYHVSLVNAGIISPNESRDALGFDPDSDPASDELRIPENIAGSAVNPDLGGRPTEGEE